MSPENIKKIQEAVKEKAKTIQLEATYYHPIRNHYAHIYSMIRQNFGKKYSECFDEDVKLMLIMIEKL